jgi:hypothetical protein
VITEKKRLRFYCGTLFADNFAELVFSNPLNRKNMLDIIALIFLCKRNGVLALQKGLKPGMWKVYTILAWICAEMIGFAIGVSMFGKPAKQNLWAIGGVGIFTAFGGYLLVRFILENKPDAYNNDEINKVGVDDLRPPKV